MQIPTNITYLRNTYEQAAERMRTRLLHEVDRGLSSTYTVRALKSIESEIKALDTFATRWSKAAVKKDYERAYTRILDNARKAQIDFPDIGMNGDKMRVLTENATGVFTAANRACGRHLKDEIRQITMDVEAQKLSSGEALRETKRMLTERLSAKGIMWITDRRGRRIPLDAYAEMAARSTHAEVVNTATITEMTRRGQDLVQMSEHRSACPMCAPLEGRVYSISGKTPGYPKLERAFGSGYANIHPNCIHTLVPYFAKYDPKAEETREKSNRSFDENPQSEQERKEYRDVQRKKALLNRDRKDLTRMREVLGDRAPTNISQMRRMRREQSKEWTDYKSAMMRGSPPRQLTTDDYIKMVPESDGQSIVDRIGTQAGPGYHRVVKDAYSMLPQNYKKFDTMLQKTSPRYPRNIENDRNSYYLPQTRNIHIEIAADRNPYGLIYKSTTVAKGSIAIHEWSHGLDYSVKPIVTMSHTPSFEKALRDDYKNLLTPERKYKKAVVDLLIGEHADRYRGVQDIINGLENTTIGSPSLRKLSPYGAYGHDASYWMRDPQNLTSEAFANIASSHLEPEAMEFLNKYFPNAYEEWNRMIDEALHKMTESYILAGGTL